MLYRVQRFFATSTGKPRVEIRFRSTSNKSFKEGDKLPYSNYIIKQINISVENCLDTKSENNIVISNGVHTYTIHFKSEWRFKRDSEEIEKENSGYYRNRDLQEIKNSSSNINNLHNLYH